MVFEYILTKNNLDPAADLTIDTGIDFGSTAAAFSGAREGESGYADFTVEFEPHATLLEEQDAGYVVASLGTDSGYVPYTAFCAKKSYLSQHSDTLQHFTNAIQKGLNYVNSHTADEIARVIEPQFAETGLHTITTIVSRYQSQDTWKKDTIFEQESFELLENILMDAGELESYVPYADLVNTSFAQKAATIK